MVVILSYLANFYMYILAVLTNVNARCGFTSQTVPVIVCPYVVDDYATGAIMGISANFDEFVMTRR